MQTKTIDTICFHLIIIFFHRVMPAALVEIMENFHLEEDTYGQLIVLGYDLLFNMIFNHYFICFAATTALKVFPTRRMETHPPPAWSPLGHFYAENPNRMAWSLHQNITSLLTRQIPWYANAVQRKFHNLMKSVKMIFFHEKNWSLSKWCFFTKSSWLLIFCLNGVFSVGQR